MAVAFDGFTDRRSERVGKEIFRFRLHTGIDAPPTRPLGHDVVVEGWYLLGFDWGGMEMRVAGDLQE